MAERHRVLFCHSGPDPWFDRPFDRLTVLSKVEGLTTLSKVEGESSFFPIDLLLDAPRIVVRGRILKSGMTGEIYLSLRRNLTLC